MPLISQGEAMWSESEEVCAWRMVLSYGANRAFDIAEFKRLMADGPMRGYYWKVLSIIAEMRVSEPGPYGLRNGKIAEEAREMKSDTTKTKAKRTRK